MPLARGVAFPFVQRLVRLNDLRADDQFVEVIVLSRNDPDTELRLMRSVKHHGLDSTRAIFTQGKAPYEYVGALDMSLACPRTELMSTRLFRPVFRRPRHAFDS